MISVSNPNYKFHKPYSAFISIISFMSAIMRLAILLAVVSEPLSE